MQEGYQGYQSLSHSKWDCKYHVVFIPKKRRRALFGRARPPAPGTSFWTWEGTFSQSENLKRSSTLMIYMR
jgi:hypothetical protein